MRVTPIIDATFDQVQSAKETAIALIGDNQTQNIVDLFYLDKLADVERGIKNLNEFSNKSWIVSSILLHSLIYDKSMYTQSGLSWADYSAQSRERLGIDARDVTEQLSAARFFIRYHKSLIKSGFTADTSNRKLARAELALKLSGDIDLVIEHLVKDTWVEFKDWYQSYKPSKNLPAPTDNFRKDIEIKQGHYRIGGVDAIQISKDIPEQDAVRLNGYIRQIFEAMQLGYEPAIVQTYDKKEAAMMERLRDKYRQGK